MKVTLVANLENGKLRVVERFQGTKPEIDDWVAEKVDEFLEYFPIGEGFFKYMFSHGHGFSIMPRKKDGHSIKVVYMNQTV